MRSRPVERRRIGPVDVAGERKSCSRPDLDDEQHDRARAGGPRSSEFVEVICPARGDAVREFGHLRPPHQVHVLDFQITRRPAGRFEQENDPAIPAKADLAPRTYSNYKLQIREHIIPAFGAMKLSKLDTPNIQALYSKKLRDGLKPSRVKYIHAVLHRALSKAVDLRLITCNPAG